MAPSPDIYNEKFTSRAVRRKHAQSTNLFAAIIFMGVYGLICYQIGASSQYSSYDEVHSHEYQNEVSRAPIRELDESQLPYNCGVLFFYHIPSTGGVSKLFFSLHCALSCIYSKA